MSYEAANREYERTLAKLDLPPGAKPPTALPTPAEKTMYESGFGVGIAERYWICAWERRWLDEQGRDAAAADAALRRLRAAPKTRFMSQQLDQAGRTMFQDYLTKAGLGDPSGLQQDVDQNCAG